MSIYRVLYYPHVLLKKKSTPVTQFTDELREFITNLINTATEFHGGGIAAPQVGVNKQIFVCDFSSIFDEKNEFFEKKEDDFLVFNSKGEKLPIKFPMVFINPEIITTNTPIITDWEGCLSLPGVTSHKIDRFHEVEIKAFDEFGNEFRVKTTHLYAAVNFQHETDHVHGILMVDRWKKEFYSQKHIVAEIQDYIEDSSYRRYYKKLKLVDATKLKFG